MMRETDRPGSASGELRRMLAPVADLAGTAVRYVHWPILLLFLAYLASGITVVRPGEVAIVLRFGRLAGANPALAVHEPGLLLAFPRPVDEVIRVEVEKVHEIVLDGFLPREELVQFAEYDPERDGYALTGDKNLVHVEPVVRYRIGDPVAWALNLETPEASIRDAVYAAFLRSAGETGIDSIFTEDRAALSRRVVERAQRRLDAIESGLRIVTLDLISFFPPPPTLEAFQAYIDAGAERERKVQEALAYAAGEVPRARGEAARIRSDAVAAKRERVEEATGTAAAFRLLVERYRAAPGVVREQLYREAVAKALGRTGRRRVVQPPAGPSYEGFRITVPTRPVR